MSAAFYMDVHIPRAITQGLRKRGVDVLTAQEDHAERLPDSEVLDRTLAYRRVVFTFDEDFLVEAHRRQSAGVFFSGVIFARPLDMTIGQIVKDLELIVQASDLADYENRVEYLPL